MTDQPLHDEATLAFYDREAGAYAARKDRAGPHLAAFLEKLEPGAKILELGCGGGQDAAAMIAAARSAGSCARCSPIAAHPIRPSRARDGA